MPMKKLVVLLCILLPAYSIAVANDENPRQTYNFNAEWKLRIGDSKGASYPAFNDEEWKTITLPRAFNEDEAFRLSIEQLTDTVVWYRKHFRLPTSDKGKKVFIEFEGVRFGADVYLNGHHMGSHENGVMAFGIDLTSAIRYNQDNIIAVRVDNSWQYREKASGSTWQWNNKNFNANYGGIPKNVFLHVTGPVYQTLPLYSNLKTTGTYIYAREFDFPNRSASIHAESEVKNESKREQQLRLEVLVVNAEGNEIARFRGNTTTLLPGSSATLLASETVNNLHFWSWGYGYLYDVYTILYSKDKVLDKVKTRTGFRKTEFRDGMVYLNDRVIQLKGYAQRTSNEWPGVGMSVAPRISDYSNRLIVEGNGNMVRWMHVAPWKQDVESCDRVGLMQMFPAGDAEKDAKGRQWEQRVELMRDAIIYNRNNPSIVLWESGNESISEEHMAEMKAIRDRYDPHGGRASGSREMLDSKEAEYGGEMLYINKSARIPMIATEYSRDEALRKYWDELTPPYHINGAGPLYRNADASAYNRNQDSFAKEAVVRWHDYFTWRAGRGKRVSSGGMNIIFSDTNTHYRGEENYRRSGETDAMRIAKDAFFAHQVMWDGWVDIENYRTHIVGHWNYAPGVIKDILVVSPSDHVELVLNGKSLGVGKKSHSFLHTFPAIEYQPGTLIALSYGTMDTSSDTGQQVISSDTLTTTGQPAALKLSFVGNTSAIRADGADMVLVQVEVVDAEGRRCPDVHPLVNFRLEGPAEWRGGIGQGRDNYILSTTLPAEAGVNRALIRSTTTAGKVKLTATSDGLRGDQLTYTTHPHPVTRGLSKVIPGDGLPSNLSRGETPSTPSYKPTLRSAIISSATAPVNQDKVGYSYDDNELTEWANDGKLSTGTITYHFDRTMQLAKASFKLTGWRSRSYEIELLAGDQVLWSGNTPPSLGYISMNFEPVSTDSVTVRLTGAGSGNDAFSGIVELAGHVELDGFRDPKGMDNKGNLRIVEAEFYEPAN